jgi:cytochrome oxidase assembly protein ShyY1
MDNDDKVILVSVVVASITGVLIFFMGLGVWQLIEPYV